MVSASDAEETGRAFARRFIERSFADAAALLTEDGQKAVVESFPDEFREGPMDAEDAFEQYCLGLYGQYGDSEAVDEASVNDDATIEFEFQFEDGTETASVDVDDDGIADLSFSPEYEIPDYADESAFSERTVTVDAGDVNLDGVLAVPEGNGPFPAVVFVHGAGIHDPDGTAGASRILKDFAWGLASEGIVTLRYAKRLHDHDVDDENRTLDRVVVDDAVAAVAELTATDEVAEDAVFVAGHSQGGMCAPRIAARHGGVAGVVVLDALADSTHDPDDLAFLRYEYEPDGDLDDEQETQFDADRETVRRIAEGEFDDDEMLWGRPGVWHRSVTACDPVGTASSLGRPVYVAKTCRADPEVQPELDAWLRGGYDDWQTANLPDGSRVEFYEGLDHYFQQGFAPTTPLSLYFGGNVDGDVVSDFVEWIDSVAP